MPTIEKLTTVVSTKGQVILPKAVRQHRDWPPGTRLVVEETTDGVLLRRAPLFEATNMSDVYGSLNYDGPTRTIEEMDDGVLAEARRRYDRD